MLDRLELDNSSYEENLEKAMELLRTQAPWWDHTEASDPGIILTEVWALLSDMQSYYMNQVNEAHYRSYLELAGMEPDHGAQACCWAVIGNVTGENILKAGVKLVSRSIVFETAQDYRLSDNVVTALHFPKEIQNEPGAELFTLELAKSWRAGKRMDFLAVVEETPGRKQPARNSFFLTRLCWEYWSPEGWERATIVSDDTCGLLFTGIIGIKAERTVPGPVRLRCVIEEGVYDFLPVIKRVTLNAVLVKQQDTLCKSLYFSYGEGRGWEDRWLPVEDYLGRTSELEIYVRSKEGCWEEFGRFCGVTPAATAEHPFRFLHFCQAEFKRLPPAGEGTIKVVCHHPRFIKTQPERRITGAAGQRVRLPWKNILPGSVGVQVRLGDKTTIFKEYMEIRTGEISAEHAWRWDGEKSELLFGDGRHGEIPPKSQDGLCITELALWNGEAGNINTAGAFAWEHPELMEGLTCTGETEVCGGRDGRTAAEQFADGLASFPGACVTAEDYARRAMETPGIVLTETSAGMTDDGGILVHIKPAAVMEHPHIRKRYCREVRRYLEQFRMVTCRITVEISGNRDPAMII